MSALSFIASVSAARGAHPLTSALPRVALAVALASGGLLGVAALAGPREVDSPEPARPVRVGPSDPAAVALLRSAADRARTTSYVGTQVVSVLGSAAGIEVVDIAHRARWGTSAVVRTAPGSRTSAEATFEPDAVPGSLSDNGTGGASSPLAAPVAVGADADRWASLVTANYRVRMAGSTRLAGEPARVVEFVRPDGTQAAQVAVGEVTGLPLQREVFDARGRVSRMSIYTDVHATGEAAVASVGQGADAAPAPIGTPLTPQALRGLGVQGWYDASSLPGGFALVDARSYPQTGPGGQTLHLTYSDGLAAISLFEQRGRLDTAALAGWREERTGGAAVLVQAGQPQRVAWSDAGTVYTLVADAPDVLGPAVSALPHRTGAGGLGVRLGRGLRRLASWANPTG